MPIQTSIDSINNSQGTQFGFKNRIINGDMRINQRGNTTMTLGNSAGYYADGYVTDRFNWGSDSANYSLTIDRSSDVPSGKGFLNSIKMTVNTANTSHPSGGFSSQIRYFIEGYDCVDLMWGTAYAVPVTLSFWVKSSLTGTYGVGFANSSANRSYLATYTIDSANTWEYKTITVAGDTSGTWNTTNGAGIFLRWGHGASSLYTTSNANTWESGIYTYKSGHADFIATAGATFYMTGVQLEKGSTASSFEFRPFTTELNLCQRYLQTVLNGGETACLGFVNGSSNAYIFHQGPVPMRAAPSVSYTTTMYATNFSSNLATITGVGGIGFAANSNVMRIHFTLNSSPTAQACGVNPSGSLIFLVSEL